MINDPEQSDQPDQPNQLGQTGQTGRADQTSQANRTGQTSRTNRTGRVRSRGQIEPDYYPIPDTVRFWCPAPKHWQGMNLMTDQAIHMVLSHDGHFTPEQARESGWVYAGATWDPAAFVLLRLKERDLTSSVRDLGHCSCGRTDITPEDCGFILNPLKRQILRLCRTCTANFEICHTCLAPFRERYARKCAWQCDQCIGQREDIRSQIYAVDAAHSHVVDVADDRADQGDHRVGVIDLTQDPERVDQSVIKNYVEEYWHQPVGWEPPVNFDRSDLVGSSLMGEQCSKSTPSARQYVIGIITPMPCQIPYIKFCIAWRLLSPGSLSDSVKKLLWRRWRQLSEPSEPHPRTD